MLRPINSKAALSSAVLAGLGVVTAFELDCAMRRDAAVHEMLTGEAASSLVIVTSQLLTDAHGTVLRACQASVVPQYHSSCSEQDYIFVSESSLTGIQSS